MTAVALFGALAIVAGAALANEANEYGPNGHLEGDENPCRLPVHKRLLCPNLRVAKPFDMSVERSGGRVRIRAANEIRSRGRGPLEMAGHRISKNRMRIVERIHYRHRRRATLKVISPGRLYRYTVPGYGTYWKFHHALRFEIRTLHPHGKRQTRRLLRTGPKLNYCFRDLFHTSHPKHSPNHPVYPGCDHDLNSKKRVLGVSPGWSDIYPASYPQQWIDVTGLRGCFLFIHRVDPLNQLYESNEHDNFASRRIKLPPRGGGVRSC